VIHGTYLLTVIYYSNTCHVFLRHLHPDMTTEDALQHHKMGRGVLNFIIAVEAPASWLLRLGAATRQNITRPRSLV
jgi:hypothetical protein